MVPSFSLHSCLCREAAFLLSWLSSKYCSSCSARASCSDSALVTVRSSWADRDSLWRAGQPQTHTRQRRQRAGRKTEPFPLLGQRANTRLGRAPAAAWLGHAKAGRRSGRGPRNLRKITVPAIRASQVFPSHPGVLSGRTAQKNIWADPHTMS